MERGEFQLVEFKATEDTDQPGGLFAALVSVFGTKDRVGDRVMPGAFTKTLEVWRTKGTPIPVIWSHDHMNPDAYIGAVDPNDVRETKDGLVVAGKMHIDEPGDDGARARRIFQLLKRGLINNWSFAYQATKAKLAKDGAREVSEVDLFEVGPTLVGAHPGTKTLALKAFDLSVDIDELVAEVEAEAAATAAVADRVEAEVKLDRIVSDEFATFEQQVDTLIQEKVGRILSGRIASEIRAAIGALQSVLVEAGVESDAASVESEGTEDTPAETPEATSEEDSEETAPTERELVLASLRATDAFLMTRRS